MIHASIIGARVQDRQRTYAVRTGTIIDFHPESDRARVKWDPETVNGRNLRTWMAVERLYFL